MGHDEEEKRVEDEAQAWYSARIALETALRNRPRQRLSECVLAEKFILYLEQTRKPQDFELFGVEDLGQFLELLAKHLDQLLDEECSEDERTQRIIVMEAVRQHRRYRKNLKKAQRHMSRAATEQHRGNTQRA